MRYCYFAFMGCLLAGCVGAEAAPTDDAGDTGGAGGTDTGAGNADGDCMTNGEELALGTDPELVDSDADGIEDCDEVACGSEPVDPADRCYTCGWKHGDPKTLVSTGAAEGDVIENVPLVDQCGETVPLWDFAQEYHILFMTAAW